MEGTLFLSLGIVLYTLSGVVLSLFHIQRLSFQSTPPPAPKVRRPIAANWFRKALAYHNYFFPGPINQYRARQSLFTSCRPCLHKYNLTAIAPTPVRKQLRCFYSATYEAQEILYSILLTASFASDSGFCAGNYDCQS